MDVDPFLEALESIGEFYTGLGIDLLKDAMLLPGVSKKYLLGGTLNKRRPGVVRPRPGGLRNAERSGCRGAEHCLWSKA